MRRSRLMYDSCARRGRGGMAQFTVAVTIKIKTPAGVVVGERETAVTAEQEVLQRLPMGMLAQETFNELLTTLLAGQGG